MVTVVGDEMLITIGNPPVTYSLILYEQDGEQRAMFGAKDEHGIFYSIPTPAIFKENDEVFDAFVEDIANLGYRLYSQKTGERLQ